MANKIDEEVVKEVCDKIIEAYELGAGEWTIALLRMVAALGKEASTRATEGVDMEGDILQTSFLTYTAEVPTLIHIVSDYNTTAEYAALVGSSAEIPEGAGVSIAINRGQYNDAVQVMAGLKGVALDNEDDLGDDESPVIVH